MPARWLSDSLTRNRDFMTLWAGESVSLLGTQITLLALPLTAALTMRATLLQMSGLYTAPVHHPARPAGPRNGQRTLHRGWRATARRAA